MIPRHARPSQSESEPMLDMSSLIDVSFLLLIFFLITSTLDPREADLAADIGNGPTYLSHDLIEYPEIKVTSEGAILWLDEAVAAANSGRSLPELSQRLQDYCDASELTLSTPAVIVDAADGSTSQRFVDVMNCLAEVGISNMKLRDFTN